MRRLFLVTMLAVFPVACSTFDDTGIPEGQGGAYPGDGGTSLGGMGNAGGAAGAGGTAGQGGTAQGGASGAGGIAGQGGTAQGGSSGAGGIAGQGGSGGPDPFTYLYENQGNGSFVRYRHVPNVFEKTSGFQRDTARQMMPIDLHTWSIANFNATLLMYSDFKLSDMGGQTLFETHDTEGAVHVTLAQTPHDQERGNNHQSALSDFLIVAGDYKLSYTLLPTSAGHPSLMLWRQRDGNRFLLLVGANPTGAEQDGINGPDGILVGFGETVERTFSVAFLDEDNALFKSNANGFEN